jgi:hypothetical protein
MLIDYSSVFKMLFIDYSSAFKMLFIDYSSAFNTVMPAKLITKQRTMGQNISLCNWILDILTGALRW